VGSEFPFKKSFRSTAYELFLFVVETVGRRNKMKSIAVFLSTTIFVILPLLMFSGCYVHFGFSDDVTFWSPDPGTDPPPPPPPPMYNPPAGSGSSTAAAPSNPHRESGYQRPSASQQTNVQRTESMPSRDSSVRTPASSGSQTDDGSSARRSSAVRTGR
jgi:hypothetical protein